MAQVRTLVTAEQFLELEGREKFPRYELVQGEVVEMAPPGGIHGGIAASLTIALGSYLRQNNLGRVVVETGYRIQRDPDTVRSPDVSFITADRLPPGGLPRGFIEGPPDVAVEVVSPSDTANEVEAKVHDYLRAGTRRVWVIYYGTRRVLAYFEDGSVKWYQEGDTLKDEEVLPGFLLPVSELFAL